MEQKPNTVVHTAKSLPDLSGVNIAIQTGDVDALLSLPLSQIYAHYENKYYDKESTILHGMAHIVAAGLTHPDMLMNYKKAAQTKPLCLPGLEAEYFAGIYHRIVGMFGEEEFDLYKNNPAMFDNILKEQALNTLQTVKNENTLLLKKGLESMTPAPSKHTQGIANYRTYLEDKHPTAEDGASLAETLWRPSLEELEWHARKSTELCIQIHNIHNKFPSQMNLAEISALPLSSLQLDTISDWDKLHKQERQKLHRCMYGYGSTAQEPTMKQ